MENWEDNELRNLYRKNGVYKVIKTINNETHVFAIFHDIEKAITYRDLFENNNWNINLKGITDINNSPNYKPKNINIIEEPEVTEVVEEIISEAEPIKEETLPVPEDTVEINDTKKTIPDEPIKEEPITTTDNEESFEKFDDKYIHFDKKRGYKIIKNVNGKTEYFGVYDTLDEAITARDYFRQHNWDINEKSKFIKQKETRYISQNNNSYIIHKSINGKLTQFGRYTNIEDAKTARDYFESHNWNPEDINKFKDKQVKSPVKERPKRYISKVDDKYQIRKKIEDKVITFGQYESIEEAMTARDYFESHDWNPDDISKFYNKKSTKNPKRYIHTTKYGYKIGKDNVHWGLFDNLEEAMAARDFLEEHDFSLEYKDKYHKKKQVSDNYFENTNLF